MNIKCLFGVHKLNLEITIRQPVAAKEDNAHLGYNVFILKKCERCSTEVAHKIGYKWHQSTEVSPDYVRALSTAGVENEQ